MPDMLVKLYDLPDVEQFVKSLDDQGIVVRRAMPYEKRTVVTWVEDTFHDGWANECEVAFSNHPISCFLATEAGSIIGFACHDSTCKNFFGPMGVAEAKRRGGIGKALFLACLHTMAAQGYAYAIVGAAGPDKFYSKVAGAVQIEGSSPGVYRDPLKQEPTEQTETA